MVFVPDTIGYQGLPVHNDRANQPEPSEDPSPDSHPMPVPDTYDPAASAQLAECPDVLHTRDGELIVCPICHAERDWLLITYAGSTSVRCRCGHEWFPSTAVNLDAAEGVTPDRYWNTLEAAIVSLGFDGMLKGIYFH